MYVKRNAELPTATIPGIEHRTLAGGDDRLEQLSIWRQSLTLDARTPRHQHDCEEVVIVLAGSGLLDIDGAIEAFGPGTTLVIPAGVTHEITVTGTDTLELIAAFSKARAAVLDPNGASIELPW